MCLSHVGVLYYVLAQTIHISKETKRQLDNIGGFHAISRGSTHIKVSCYLFIVEQTKLTQLHLKMKQQRNETNKTNTIYLKMKQQRNETNKTNTIHLKMKQQRSETNKTNTIHLKMKQQCNETNKTNTLHLKMKQQRNETNKTNNTPEDETATQ